MWDKKSDFIFKAETDSLCINYTLIETWQCMGLCCQDFSDTHMVTKNIVSESAIFDATC